MPLAAVNTDTVAAVFLRPTIDLRDTSSDRLALFRDAHYEFTTSAVWALEEMKRFAKDRIDRALALNSDWNSYGAPVPSAEAGTLAKQIIDSLESDFFFAPEIVPSSEGGIAATFSDIERFAQIECLNSGTVLVTTFSKTEEPSVVALKSSEVRRAVQTIRDFLS